MIVVETSAVIAILLGEPERDAFLNILASDELALPASCLLEASASFRRKRHDPRMFDDFIASFSPRILPFDETQARIAVEADRRYGRDSGHPARLNFGDCMSYAAAIALGAPLLFKGGDFALTDVRRAAA